METRGSSLFLLQKTVDRVPAIYANRQHLHLLAVRFHLDVLSRLRALLGRDQAILITSAEQLRVVE
jgi:hypothetical protein